jgi:hypothetical protein
MGRSRPLASGGRHNSAQGGVGHDAQPAGEVLGLPLVVAHEPPERDRSHGGFGVNRRELQ